MVRRQAAPIDAARSRTHHRDRAIHPRHVETCDIDPGEHDQRTGLRADPLGGLLVLAKQSGLSRCILVTARKTRHLHEQHASSQMKLFAFAGSTGDPLLVGEHARFIAPPWNGGTRETAARPEVAHTTSTRISRSVSPAPRSSARARPNCRKCFLPPLDRVDDRHDVARILRRRLRPLSVRSATR
jgi:hypothetical protein